MERAVMCVIFFNTLKVQKYAAKKKTTAWILVVWEVVYKGTKNTGEVLYFFMLFA